MWIFYDWPIFERGSIFFLRLYLNQSTSFFNILEIAYPIVGATKYSQMASTTQRRALFIQSALDMVRAHGFDGLDLDWEYPGKNHLHLMYRLASETFQTTLVGISVLRGPC